MNIIALVLSKFKSYPNRIGVTNPKWNKSNVEESFSPANLAKQDYDPLPLLELDLSHNSLSTLQRTAFVHLTNLEVLDLSGNPIEEVR